MYVCMYVCIYIKLNITAQSGPYHPSHSLPLALILPRGNQWYLYVCMNVCMHVWSSHLATGYEVANPARGQLNRKMVFSLSPFAPENLVSRDGFGGPVPRQPAHLHTQSEYNAYLRDSSRVPRWRPFLYLEPPYAIGFIGWRNINVVSCWLEIHRRKMIKGKIASPTAVTSSVNACRSHSKSTRQWVPEW